MNYNKITLEECFVYYHTGKTACECDADKEEVRFYKKLYFVRSNNEKRI